MSDNSTSRSRVRQTGFFILTVLIAMATAWITPVGTAQEESAHGLTLTYVVQVTTKPISTSDPTCAGVKFDVEGSVVVINDPELVFLDELTTGLDPQSHCVRAVDGAIVDGVFTLTGAMLGGPPGGQDSGDSITGQYRAHLVPTANSVPPTPTSGPSGYWVIFGEVCTWKGTGRFADVVNDCPLSETGNPGRFVPARGSADLDSGNGSVSGTMAVRFQ